MLAGAQLFWLHLCPGTSLRHTTARNTNYARCKPGWVTRKRAHPVITWQGLKQTEVQVPEPCSWLLQQWPKPYHPTPSGLFTSGDSPSVAPGQVRAPTSPPESLLFAPGVYWTLSPPLCYLLFFIKTLFPRQSPAGQLWVPQCLSKHLAPRWLQQRTVKGSRRWPGSFIRSFSSPNCPTAVIH